MVSQLHQPKIQVSWSYICLILHQIHDYELPLKLYWNYALDLLVVSAILLLFLKNTGLITFQSDFISLANIIWQKAILPLNQQNYCKKCVYFCLKNLHLNLQICIPKESINDLYQRFYIFLCPTLRTGKLKPT